MAHFGKILMAALLAGTLAATAAGSFAWAAPSRAPLDPAQLQQRLEKRVDRALEGTGATADQKKQIAQILGSSFRDTRPLRDKRVEDRKAMQAALQAPALDPARVEAIRSDEMKIADERSKIFTKALTDAGNVLSAEQRQTFFKNWNNRPQRGRHG